MLVWKNWIACAVSSASPAAYHEAHTRGILATTTDTQAHESGGHEFRHAPKADLGPVFSVEQPSCIEMRR